MTLYELTAAMEGFDFEIDEETGEILNMDELDRIEMARDEKLKNCVRFYKNQKAEEEALKVEIDKLTARKKTAKNKAERMKDYIDFCTDGKDFKPQDDPTIRVMHRNTKSVGYKDWKDVDENYLRYKDPEVNKSEILKVLRAGGQVKGCWLEEKRSMQIK